MLQGYKTLIVAVAVAVFGVLSTADWVTLLHNPTTAGYVVTGIGIAMAALRFVTTTPVGESKP
jgi:hypothetical protein